MSFIKHDSIKFRIAVWYLAFIVLIGTSLVGVLVFSQRISSEKYYAELLARALDETAEAFHTLDDVSDLELRLDYGAHIAVLDGDGELIAGERSFELKPWHEKLNLIREKHDEFLYIQDRYLELDDSTGVWLRAYISSFLIDRYNHTITVALLLVLPALFLAVALGGYMLTKRIFRPLDDIISTAEAITTSSDLQQRIPAGSRQDEVHRLANALNGMLARLERSIDAEKQFISDASHELRTPLSVIRSQSEFALRKDADLQEKDAALEIIHERSVSTGQMLSHLLFLSRMDFEKVALNIEHVDLSELTERIAQEMEVAAAKHSITVIKQIANGVCCDCDELLIIRLVSNLMENAIHYGREGGYVRLELASDPGFVVLRVRDNGIGISKKDLPRIWQRFYQADKSRTRDHGFGLGLSIVRWIVDAHNGRIDVDSVFREGTCFTVRLPVHADKASDTTI
ncbi:MAG: HAMP domain-containing histidine kinase [Clostridia bacterium]|nr:HAMP domain-containing histidine kinase [Clostridia bacterium]